ncbi:MAG: MotA/TolQ/ExbB proton channel family protein [Kiritimatiellia bacterium]
MKSKKGPISLIVVGSLLALGPLWGVLGTVIGMLRAFGTLNNSGPATSERLASDISVSLWSTMAGLLMSPIGVAVLIGGIVWLIRMNRREKAANQQMQTIAAKRGSV